MRERGMPARLPSAECVDALLELGVVFDLHNDRTARLDLDRSMWRVRRMGAMTVTDGGERAYTSATRPVTVAEAWLVAAVGERTWWLVSGCTRPGWPSPISIRCRGECPENSDGRREARSSPGSAAMMRSRAYRHSAGRTIAAEPMQILCAD